MNCKYCKDTGYVVDKTSAKAGKSKKKRMCRRCDYWEVPKELTDLFKF